ELHVEFRAALRQLDAGADLVQVLGDIECDLDVVELSNVLGLLRQIERYGGEIRESLLSVLSLIEERRVLSLRERVNQLAGRMTVVMVMFFFPALLLCIAGPAFTAIIFALKGVAS
ncbi:MAG: type II secretion system F family protein, partial [Nevskiales bacterium]